MNIIDKFFLPVILLAALSILVGCLGIFLVNTIISDHSIVRYEFSDNHNSRSSETVWTIRGTRNYWTDDIINFPRNEFSLEQVREEVRNLNLLLVEQEIRELNNE